MMNEGCQVFLPNCQALTLRYCVSGCVVCGGCKGDVNKPVDIKTGYADTTQARTLVIFVGDCAEIEKKIQPRTLLPQL